MLFWQKEKSGISRFFFLDPVERRLSSDDPLIKRSRPASLGEVEIVKDYQNSYFY